MKKYCAKVTLIFIYLLIFNNLICFAEEPVKAINNVTLPKAHKGTLEIDTLLLDSYGKLPENRRQFYLDAREILTGSPNATLNDPGIIEAAKKAELKLISGPMLGNVSDNGITVWFRPVNADTYIVSVKADGEDDEKKYSKKVSEAGTAASIELTDLKENQKYRYKLLNSAGDVIGEGNFKTAPKAGSGEITRIAFGSCFHKIGVHNPNLMKLIVKRNNLAMLLLGDLAVDDRETKLNMHYSDYLLRDVSKSWRNFSANIPVYASWDDHDYLNNDKSGLQKGRITNEARNSLRKLWQENWINPVTEVEDRGIYFNTVIGDIEVVMLDTRSCRDWNIRGKRNSYLGEEQMQWLFNTLKASKAKFIILTSGTMWSDYMSKAKDSWGTWDIEGRNKIFDFIEKNKIGGVLLLSGDRHGARGFKIQRPSGFILYEFEVATLGGVRGPGPFAPDKSNQIFGYGRMKAFGEFTFDLRKTDPEVTFRLINEHGKELEKHTLKRSQLLPTTK